jgi:hypothetical protein
LWLEGESIIGLKVVDMEFQILSRDNYEEWDRFVDISPQGSIFAKTFYLDAIGLPHRIGAVFKGETIEGGIVLAKNEIRAYSNPMFAKYLGILLRPFEGKYVNRLTTEKEIIEHIVLNIKWCKTFDYTFHPYFRNWLPFYWNGYRQETRYTYRIYDIEKIAGTLGNMHSRVRKNIRKAERNNIRIEYDISLDDFYQINKLTYERKGSPIPYTFSFIQRFYDRLKREDAIKLLGAKDDDNRLHAVCGIVYDRRSCFFILNGINPHIENTEANTLLVVKTIEYASRVSGIFDFEGSMIKSIEGFYRGFGGVLTPYYNIWKSNLLNNAKRLAVRCYKKLKYGK